MASKAFVVFGYGSLIFKPPPHTIAQVPGFLKGYVRRFAQKSHDHRGTPENPGRVVTLIHKEDWDKLSVADAFPGDDVVWGIAYTIDSSHEVEVRTYLDFREKDGYTMETDLDIYGIKNGCEEVVAVGACCYIGKTDNPSFIGSEPLDVLANHIWRSAGQSGRNKDYLYDLAEAIRRLGPESHDPHLHALETRLQKLDADNRSDA